MSALQTIERATAIVSDVTVSRPAGPFMLEILGDHMEPTYRAGTHQLVMRPVDRFEYDGVYALDIEGQPLAYRCQSDFQGGIHVQPDNSAYTAWTVPRAAFALIVLGIAVGEVRILERSAFSGSRTQYAEGQILAR